MVMLNLAMAFERTDEVILPALYAFVAASFNASLTQIAYLTLARALAQAVFSPLGGFSGYYWNRAAVIGLGATVWGCTMVAFACELEKRRERRPRACARSHPCLPFLHP